MATDTTILYNPVDCCKLDRITLSANSLWFCNICSCQQQNNGGRKYPYTQLAAFSQVKPVLDTGTTQRDRNQHYPLIPVTKCAWKMVTNHYK